MQSIKNSEVKIIQNKVVIKLKFTMKQVMGVFVSENNNDDSNDIIIVLKI